MMRVFDVFSGIGGMSLGLDRAGFETVGFCEIEPFCNAVLAKHWPHIWRWNDVKTLTGELIRDNCGRVDALVGGPPCQPSSLAGRRRGAADDRWLWPEFLRLVSEVSPVWVLAENPRGVLSIEIEGVEFSQWLAREFENRGYSLLPVELAAEDLGAPHRRERVWFVGYATSARLARDTRREPSRSVRDETRRAQFAGSDSGGSDVAYSGSSERRPPAQGRIDDNDRANAGWEETPSGSELCGETVADSHNSGSSRLPIGTSPQIAQSGIDRCWPAGPRQPQHEWEEPRVITTELQMGCAVDGLSIHVVRRRRVAALKGLGNAVVPQCAEVIGRAIIEADRRFMSEEC